MTHQFFLIYPRAGNVSRISQLKVILDLEMICIIRGNRVFLVVMATDALTCTISQFDIKTFVWPQRDNVGFCSRKLNQLYLLIVVTSCWVRKSVINAFNYIYICI